ncbi:hypothetical protein SNEBB_002525 [Seison nebaliae]|nr:hypothetical protein SNEBB_002525 [Seison nebaliae]
MESEQLIDNKLAKEDFVKLTLRERNVYNYRYVSNFEERHEEKKVEKSEIGSAVGSPTVEKIGALDIFFAAFGTIYFTFFVFFLTKVLKSTLKNKEMEKKREASNLFGVNTHEFNRQNGPTSRLWNEEPELKNVEENASKLFAAINKRDRVVADIMAANEEMEFMKRNALHNLSAPDTSVPNKNFNTNQTSSEEKDENENANNNERNMTHRRVLRTNNLLTSIRYLKKSLFFKLKSGEGNVWQRKHFHRLIIALESLELEVHDDLFNDGNHVDDHEKYYQKLREKIDLLC